MRPGGTPAAYSGSSPATTAGTSGQLGARANAPATAAQSAPARSPSSAEASLERETEAGELVVRVAALDGRLEIEDLGDVRILPDQLAGAARQGLLGRRDRLKEVEGAP